MGQSPVSHTLLKSLHSENTLKTQTRSPFLEYVPCVLQVCYTLYIESHGLISPSKWSCLIWITCCVYRKGIRMIESFYTSRKGGEHLNAVYLSYSKAKSSFSLSASDAFRKRCSMRTQSTGHMSFFLSLSCWHKHGIRFQWWWQTNMQSEVWVLKLEHRTESPQCWVHRASL